MAQAKAQGRTTKAAVVNMSSPVFIGTEERIFGLFSRLAGVAVVNMDSPNFIVLANEPDSTQLARAITTATSRRAMA